MTSDESISLTEAGLRAIDALLEHGECKNDGHILSWTVYSMQDNDGIYRRYFEENHKAKFCPKCGEKL